MNDKKSDLPGAALIELIGLGTGVVACVSANSILKPNESKKGLKSAIIWLLLLVLELPFTAASLEMAFPALFPFSKWLGNESKKSETDEV